MSLPSLGWTRTRAATDSGLCPAAGSQGGSSLSLDAVCPAPNPTPWGCAPGADPSALLPQSSGGACGFWGRLRVLGAPAGSGRLQVLGLLRVLGAPVPAGPHWSVLLVLRWHPAHKPEAWVTTCRMGGP